VRLSHGGVKIQVEVFWVVKAEAARSIRNVGVTTQNTAA
jgi:hypothetical protein